jgi:hypothetical protein
MLHVESDAFLKRSLGVKLCRSEDEGCITTPKASKLAMTGACAHSTLGDQPGTASTLQHSRNTEAITAAATADRGSHRTVCGSKVYGAIVPGAAADHSATAIAAGPGRGIRRATIIGIVPAIFGPVPDVPQHIIEAKAVP